MKQIARGISTYAGTGFTIGTNGNVNVSDETIMYTAFR